MSDTDQNISIKMTVTNQTEKENIINTLKLKGELVGLNLLIDKLLKELNTINLEYIFILKEGSTSYNEYNEFIEKYKSKITEIMTNNESIKQINEHLNKQ
jgi:hypothetical protein